MGKSAQSAQNARIDGFAVCPGSYWCAPAGDRLNARSDRERLVLRRSISTHCAIGKNAFNIITHSECLITMRNDIPYCGALCCGASCGSWARGKHASMRRPGHATLPPPSMTRRPKSTPSLFAVPPSFSRRLNFKNREGFQKWIWLCGKKIPEKIFKNWRI